MSAGHALEGWSFGRAEDHEWMPWGGSGARAKVLASGDGVNIALVEAEPGYRGDPHVHERTEMLHVLSGTVVSNGVEMGPGEVYVAAAGSRHESFHTEAGATYLSIFAL